MALRPIFRGFCINRFGIGPLHYISSSFDFGFEFGQKIVIEKRPSDSASRRVGYWMWKLPSSVSWRVVDSPSRRVGESVTPWLAESERRRLPDSPSRGVTMVSRGVAIRNCLNLSSIYRILNSVQFLYAYFSATDLNLSTPVWYSSFIYITISNISRYPASFPSTNDTEIAGHNVYSSWKL